MTKLAQQQFAWACSRLIANHIHATSSSLETLMAWLRENLSDHSTLRRAHLEVALSAAMQARNIARLQGCRGAHRRARTLIKSLQGALRHEQRRQYV
jgi:hypothetical protein